MVQFTPGVRPNDPRKARLYFRMFRQAGAVAPASADYSGFSPIGMLGNDTAGDCVYACDGHITEQQTALGQGSEVVVTTQEAISAYSDQTGYDPSQTQPDGSNPTDQGDTVQHGLEFMVNTGFSGHKIAAFAQLDATNHEDVKLAIAEFGSVDLGMAFPASAMDQFNAGQPWTVVSGAQIEGGHCILGVGYDATYIYVVTWGKIQPMTWAFFDAYIAQQGEAWAVISEDWVSKATGKDPEGIDKHAFGAQFAALTGKPNPFPAPVPTPTPTPAPGPDDADKALADVVNTLRWAWPPRLVKALNAWLTAKNL